jgi:hypothetical protein
MRRATQYRPPVTFALVVLLAAGYALEFAVADR